jgi:hypothetical protein
LVAGIKAVQTWVTKNGNVIERPDPKVRLDYLKFVTEHVEGMPVRRQEVISWKILWQCPGVLSALSITAVTSIACPR